MRIIHGYKAFNSNLTNNYGKKFTEGEIYHMDGDISFGINGNGFHFCKRLEDTFRYINDDDKKVAKVIGFGIIKESFDNYNEYFDMYSASFIKIMHFLSRQEVINYILHANEHAVIRFIVTGFKLTDNELMLFRQNFSESILINNYLDYYYLGDSDAFTKKVLKKKL